MTRSVLEALAIAAWLALAGACVHARVRPPVPLVACDAAEARLLELGCEGIDASFSEVCERALLDGLAWHPECLAHLTSCRDEDLEAAWAGECSR